MFCPRCSHKLNENQKHKHCYDHDIEQLKVYYSCDNCQLLLEYRVLTYSDENEPPEEIIAIIDTHLYN